MVSPYEDATEIHVVPPLKPDVAIVHAQRADAERRRADLGAARLSEGGRVRGRPRDRGVRGDGGGVGDPRRPEPHRDPRRDRRRRGGGAVRVPSVVHAGLLRPRQRVLPGVGRDRARRRRRSRRGSTNGCTAWRTTPSTSRSWARASGTRCGPSRPCRARSTTGGTRERRRSLLEVRDHDRGQRPPAWRRRATASSAWACRTSCATWRSEPWRRSSSWCTSPACSARDPSGCRCRSATRRS